MRKLELYQCDVCGTQYKSKEDCVKCEKSHPKELRIIDARYLSLAQDKSGMPVTITVSGTDGKKYTYKR